MLSIDPHGEMTTAFTRAHNDPVTANTTAADDRREADALAVYVRRVAGLARERYGIGLNANRGSLAARQAFKDGVPADEYVDALAAKYGMAGEAK